MPITEIENKPKNKILENGLSLENQYQTRLKPINPHNAYFKACFSRLAGQAANTAFRLCATNT